MDANKDDTAVLGLLGRRYRFEHVALPTALRDMY